MQDGRYYFGQIHLAYVKDGAGHTKEHPVLVVDSDEGCASGDPIQVVVISTKIEEPYPHHHIRVHDERRYDRVTGLFGLSRTFDDRRSLIDRSKSLVSLHFWPHIQPKWPENGHWVQLQMAPGFRASDIIKSAGEPLFEPCVAKCN